MEILEQPCASGRGVRNDDFKEKGWQIRKLQKVETLTVVGVVCNESDECITAVKLKAWKMRMNRH